MLKVMNSSGKGFPREWIRKLPEEWKEQGDAMIVSIRDRADQARLRYLHEKYPTVNIILCGRRSELDLIHQVWEGKFYVPWLHIPPQYRGGKVWELRFSGELVELIRKGGTSLQEDFRYEFYSWKGSEEGVEDYKWIEFQTWNWLKIRDIPKLPLTLTRNLEVRNKSLKGWLRRYPVVQQNLDTHHTSSFFPNGLDLYRYLPDNYETIQVNATGWPLWCIQRSKLRWFLKDRCIRKGWNEKWKGFSLPYWEYIPPQPQQKLSIAIQKYMEMVEPDLDRKFYPKKDWWGVEKGCHDCFYPTGYWRETEQKLLRRERRWISEGIDPRTGAEKGSWGELEPVYAEPFTNAGRTAHHRWGSDGLALGIPQEIGGNEEASGLGLSSDGESEWSDWFQTDNYFIRDYIPLYPPKDQEESWQQLVEIEEEIQRILLVLKKPEKDVMPKHAFQSLLRKQKGKRIKWKSEKEEGEPSIEREQGEEIQWKLKKIEEDLLYQNYQWHVVLEGKEMDKIWTWVWGELQEAKELLETREGIVGEEEEECL